MQVKRMQDICEMLEEDGSVDVKSLSKLHNVTEKTIRHDLNKMEEMGLLERVRGGAILKVASNSVFPIKSRRKLHIDEKMRIAQAANELIHDGDVVILDNGTTTLELTKLLKKKKIIVITNDLSIVNELCTSETVTLYVTGGRLKTDTHYSFIGPDAIRTLKEYHATIAFLGTSTISIEKGLMVFSAEEADVKKAMIAVADRAVCLADYTKFHQTAFVRFAGIEDLYAVITDRSIPHEDIAQLESHGVRVICA